MKLFSKAQILEIAESGILCVESGAGNDAALQNWLRSLSVEL